MDTLKRSRGQLVLVADEFGAIEGLVTPIDVFEAIAGEFPDEDELPDITPERSEEHTSELQSLMRRSYAVFCLKKKSEPPLRQHRNTDRTNHRKRDERIT